MAVEYHLYGNLGSGGPVDYSTILATVIGNSWSPPPLATGSNWTFAVRAFDPATGFEELNVDARVSVVVDGSGNDATATPAPAMMVTALPLVGGTARVDWVQVSSGRSRAASFQVFANAGSTITPTSPATTTVQTLDGINYSATVSGISDGAAWCVMVRTLASSGLHSDSATVTLVGSASGPAPVATLTASTTSISGTGPSGA